MFKRTSTVILTTVCMMWTFSFSQDQDSTRKAPLLTFEDLQKNDGVEGPFRIEGFVINIYRCPPCPPLATCKPCIPDHIEVTDNLDEKNPTLIKRLRIFADKPEGFELKKRYAFVVKVKGQAPRGRAIENVDLISSDSVREPKE
jgi:hypothetical protein